MVLSMHMINLSSSVVLSPKSKRFLVFAGVIVPLLLAIGFFLASEAVDGGMGAIVPGVGLWLLTIVFAVIGLANLISLLRKDYSNKSGGK